MEQKVLIFDKQCINKNAFHKRMHLIDIDKVDIVEIVIFSKDSYGKKGSFKYFIGYITNYIKPLCTKRPQINGYVKYFTDKKCMNFLVHDKKFPKNTMQYGIRLVI